VPSPLLHKLAAGRESLSPTLRVVESISAFVALLVVSDALLAIKGAWQSRRAVQARSVFRGFWVPVCYP